jgi:hypothetical protein
MRIKTETLLRLAKDWIQQRLRTDRNILAIYLQGSLLSDTPDLGGAVDIDLFAIRVDSLEPLREIHRITDDIHLDVLFQPREVYRSTTGLRVDPVLGPAINGCMILHDPQHFLDFIQAGVRSQFDRAENVHRRARQCGERARSAWLGFQMEPPQNDPQGVRAYLDAVENAANAVSLLAGPCLVERRFLPQFERRANALNREGLFAGLMGLIGAVQIEPQVLHDWLPAWRASFDALSEGEAPARLHPQRVNYYRRAFDYYLSAENTARMALWPLLRTWTDMACLNVGLEGWEAAIAQLGWSVEGFAGRLEALDAYLDTVDETLDRWAAGRGLS